MSKHTASVAESSVKVNGVTIAYRIQGSGPALLAVMGLGGQLTDWTPELIEGLAEHFTVITFDNRDVGLSTISPGAAPTTRDFMKARLLKRSIPSDYTLVDMAADAIGLVDELGISSVHAVGLSMGGMIAQTLAIIYPDRIRSLTSIMSTTGDIKAGSIDPKVMLSMGRMDLPTTVEEAVESSVAKFRLFAGSSWSAERHEARSRHSFNRSWHPDGVGRQLAAIAAAPDRTPELRKLSVPTLVVHGMQDKLVRPSGGTATAAAVPGSRLLMFPDMGHDIPMNRCGEIVDAIVANAARASVV